VDEAINEVRKLEPQQQKPAMAMKQAIEDFHKFALTKMVKTLKEDESGKALLFEMVDDPAIYALFAMHGIVRADINTRVSRVIDMVRPYMQSHGGDVELVRVEPETVFIKLHGACNGCSMSSVTLRNGVEEALKEHVPEIKHIEVLPNDPGPSMISLDSIGMIMPEKDWVAGPAVGDVKEGSAYRMDIEDHDGVVIIRIGDQLQAYRNACAHQGLPIDGGMLDTMNGTITCPWHGFCFDATSGECLTAPQAQLEPFLLRVEDGRIFVRPS
ncbi:MAG: NifU family protein, partial [Chloroflexota bacterium]